MSEAARDFMLITLVMLMILVALPVALGAAGLPGTRAG